MRPIVIRAREGKRASRLALEGGGKPAAVISFRRGGSIAGSRGKEERGAPRSSKMAAGKKVESAERIRWHRGPRIPFCKEVKYMTRGKLKV